MGRRPSGLGQRPQPVTRGKARQVRDAGAELDGHVRARSRTHRRRGGARSALRDASAGAGPGHEVALGYQLLIALLGKAARDAQLARQDARRRQTLACLQATHADRVAQLALKLGAERSVPRPIKTEKDRRRELGPLDSHRIGPYQSSIAGVRCLPMTAATALTADTLHKLIEAIRAAARRSDNWADAATQVAQSVRGRLPAASIFCDAQGTAAATGRLQTRPLHVEPDGSFSMVALACPPHQATVIHDHVTWCVFAVLAGTPVEERFVLDQTGAALEPAGRQRCLSGTVIGGAPPGDIHRLSNPGAQTAVSLHIYGSDITRLGSSVRRIYDLPIATPTPQEHP